MNVNISVTGAHRRAFDTIGSEFQSFRTEDGRVGPFFGREDFQHDVLRDSGGRVDGGG